MEESDRRTYLGMVSAMDEIFGTIIKTLEENEMLENSVIIFSSDNGGNSGSGGASNFPLNGNKGTFLFIHSQSLLARFG